MLDTDTILVSGNSEFDQYPKKYFVNMTSNIRTLHKTNTKCCPHSTHSYRFIPFNSLQEVQQFEKAHQDATPFKRCGNCFKKRK